MAKKTPQAQPGRSIVFLSSEHPPEVHRLTPSTSYSSSSNVFRSPSPSYHPLTENSNLSPPRNNYPSLRTSNSYPRMDNIPQSCTWQPAASPYASYHQSMQERGSVDIERLNNIYKEHASGFWSTIAAKYSVMDRLTPYELEHAFFSRIAAEEASTVNLMSNSLPNQSTASMLPRSVSPSPMYLRQDQESNAANIGRCSVESLLNHRG